jgi:predicted Zn finger-like uncharacterized protein
MTTRTVACPYCNAIGSVNLDKANVDTLSIRCPKCGKSFNFLKERRYSIRLIPLPTVRMGPYAHDFDCLPRKGTLLDISSSGMRVKVSGSAPARGEIYNFEFRLPPTYEAIKVGGMVRWVKQQTTDESGYEMGIEFVGLEAHAQKLIGFFMLPN